MQGNSFVTDPSSLTPAAGPPPTPATPSQLFRESYTPRPSAPKVLPLEENSRRGDQNDYFNY